MAADDPFKLHFSLSVGGESEFVFRGVEVLPEVKINVFKALTEAVNAVPGFRSYLATMDGITPKQFATIAGAPTKPIETSRESGLYYVDGNISAVIPKIKTNVTLGAFYGTQSSDRVDHSFFGGPLYDEYHEFDSYLSFSRAFGPVNISLGGTFYHVVNNSDSDTAELNFGVAYTAPQFPYVTASFSYDYTAAFALSDYPINGQYLDGHYLEARLDGNIPVPYTHNIVKFQPYILVSAGSGIIARTLNLIASPTYANTERYAQASQAYVDAVFQSIVNGNNAPTTTSASAARAAIDPNTLDRSFDLSNFQTGFRVPIYLTRYFTLRGDFNYSRPLGNLDREPYNQKDQIWAGGTVTLSF